MIKRTLGCAALCGWLMANVSLQAHHSLAGVYDMKKETELSGSVEKIQFSNPHGSLVIAEKSGWFDNRLGHDTRVRYSASAAGDR
jgi:Family of unknown function (DUF6152)